MASPRNREARLLAEHDFTCSVCAAPAGKVWLKMKGDTPKLFVSSFTGRIEARVRPEALAVLERALSDGEVRTLFGIDLEFAPFYCPSCNACYCNEHWVYWNVFEEDGWFDSTRGVCPAGHERMLSD